MLYEDKQCIFLERAMRGCIDTISGTAIIISLICAPTTALCSPSLFWVPAPKAEASSVPGS